MVQQHFQKDGQTLPNETLQMAPEAPAPPNSGTQPSLQPPH
jgi:hypothetical protein